MSSGKAGVVMVPSKESFRGVILSWLVVAVDLRKRKVCMLGAKGVGGMVYVGEREYQRREKGKAGRTTVY